MEYVLEAYRSIVEPLLPLGKRGLKAFLVYWACFHDYEEEAEKEVMGDCYQAEGKIPSEERNSFYPHGGHSWKVEEGGMDLR